MPTTGSGNEMPPGGRRDRPQSSSNLPRVRRHEKPLSMADLPPVVPPELKKGKGLVRAALPSGTSKGEPFRGVVPFDPSSMEVFFGRRSDVENVHAMVAQKGFRVGVLTGEPGVGKTSLLLCGLAQHMKRVGLLPVYIQCREDLRERFSKSFAAAGAREPMPDEELAEYALRISRNTPDDVVILLDDVSDILSGTDDRAKRDLARFAGQINAAPDSRVRVLLTIESDRFHHLMDLGREAGIAISRATVYRLERLDMDACAEVIEQGALASGIYFEAGLSKLMSQDLAGMGPVLPLDIQVVVTGAIERKHLTARRYLRAGGAEVLRAGWLQTQCRKIGGSAGLGVLSELADRRALGPGWCRTGELGRACGLGRDRAERTLAGLGTQGLVETRTLGEDAEHRLVQPGLTPLIRQVDGALRHRRTRARMTIRRRVVAGGLLRPWELLSIVTSPPRTAEEVNLVRRSLYVLAAGVGGVAVLAALFFLWIHVAAGGGFHLGFRGKEGPASGTVVVRKGRPGYAKLDPFSHTPKVGAVLVDTGFGMEALAKGAISKVRSGRLAGDLDARKQGLPVWFHKVLALLKPCVRGKALVLLGKADQGWKLVARTTQDRGAFRRALSLVALVGQGHPAETPIVEKALKSQDSDLRLMALETVLETARRKPGAYKDVLARAARDPSPAVSQRLLQAAEDMPAEPALALALLTLDRKDARGLADAARLAVRWAKKRPADAAKILAAAAAGPDRSLSIRAARYVRKLLKTQTAAAAAGLAARLMKTEDPKAQALALEWLAALDPKHLPSRKDLPARVLGLCQSPNRSVMRNALTLAVNVVATGELEKKLGELASARGKDAIRLNALAARAYGELLKKNKPADLKRLRAMTKSDHAEVRAAALEALSWGPAASRLTVLNAGSDRVARVRAAAVASLGAWSLGNPAKVLFMLNTMTKGGGNLMRAALARAGARLVSSRNHWWIVTGHIKPALRRGDPSVRRAGVRALGAVAHHNPRSALALLNNLLTDPSAKVKTALVAALLRLTATLPDEVGKALLTLAADANPAVSSKAMDALRPLVTRPALSEQAGKVLTTVLKRSTGGPEVESALELVAAMPADKRPKGMAAAVARALTAARSQDVKQLILDSSRTLKLAEPALAACRDVSAAVRISGLSLIAELKTPKAGAALLKGLDDPEAKVQLAALDAAARLGADADPVLTRALAKIASNPKHALRLKALELLAGTDFKDKTHRDEVRALVLSAAESRYVPDRMTAARAAARRPDAYKEFLHRLMNDPAVEVRRQATLGRAVTLAASKTPAELKRMMDRFRADRKQRFAAALALHLQLDPASGKAKDAGDALAAARKSLNPLTRLLAGAALMVARPAGGRTRLPDLLELVLLF